MMGKFAKTFILVMGKYTINISRHDG